MAAPMPMRQVGRIEMPTIGQRSSAKTEPVVAAPVDNPIYKMAIADGSPDAKRQQIAHYLTATESKTENAARVAQWQEVEAWLEEEFQRGQKERIHLTDTETFSVLQGVYQDMYGALDDFKKQMEPLTTLLDGLYALNVADKTYDAYLEVKADEEADAKRAEQRRALEDRFSTTNRTIDDIKRSIAHLGEEKTWFGLGGVRKSARQEIAEKELALTDAIASLDQLSVQVAAFDAGPQRESALGDLAVHKEEIKRLLNISGDEFKAQQTRLVQSALTFIDNQKKRLGEVQTHLGKMTEQVDALYDMNGRMNRFYALVGDSVSDAMRATAEARKEDEVVPDQEDLSSKLRRADRLTVRDVHAQALAGAQRTCATGYAQTSDEEVRLRTMRDAVDDKIDKARVMATQGTSSVAGQLATVISAVNDAALGQSEAALRDTLTKMSDYTTTISQKQVVQQSLGAQRQAADLQRTIANLGQMRDVVKASRELMEQGVNAVSEAVGQVKGLAEDLGNEASSARAVFSREQEKA